MDALIAGARSLGLELIEEQIDRYRRYLRLLTAWNARVNLTSPAALADAERVHFLDSLTLVPEVRRLLPDRGSLVDVGSGAGFPGLALRIAVPGLRVTLIEATAKKAEFLQAVCAELGVEDVAVIVKRAEEVARDSAYREEFDIATARALGPFPVVLELTLPFCRVGGTLIAPRGLGAEQEAADCARPMEALGGRLREVLPVDVPGLLERRSVVIVDKIAATPSRYPRRTGMPEKRPLA